MKTSEKEGCFGIVVSGGPAPGINCVISSAVIHANNLGFEVKGIVDGFKGFENPYSEPVLDLRTEIVSNIYNTGGSILGATRFNPFTNPESRRKFINGLQQYKIDKLIVIGGEGSAYLSHQLITECPEIRVAHVPKTIDNDLILPGNHPSFGFETARFVGTQIVDTLMVDAKTTRRWFLVTSMGRKAGFLALGLGLAAGATLTLIPEQFPKKNHTPDEVADLIFHSMKRRWKLGKPYGVALIAEGVLDCLDAKTCSVLQNCSRDELGRIKYSQIEIGDVVLPPLRDRLIAEDMDLKVITKNIGYELRCHAPVSFDIEYTKFLGYGAVKLLLDGHNGVMVTRDFDMLGFERLDDLARPDGTIISRQVDLSSDLYRVARSFMML